MSIQFGPEWRDLQNRLTRYPQVTEAHLRRTLTASLLMVEADAKRNVRQDTRRLAGSINHEIRGAYPHLVGRVGPSLQYGVVVEFGRRPNRPMPPVDALLGWVRRHWAPSGADAVRIASARFPGRARNQAWRRSAESALRSRAFVLARSIGRKGIPARPFLRPAWQRNEGPIRAMFGRIGARVTGYLAGGPAL